jgi:hypothetical protein
MYCKYSSLLLKSGNTMGVSHNDDDDDDENNDDDCSLEFALGGANFVCEVVVVVVVVVVIDNGNDDLNDKDGMTKPEQTKPFMTALQKNTIIVILLLKQIRFGCCCRDGIII